MRKEEIASRAATVVLGFVFVSGCATATIAPPEAVDISQVPGLVTAVCVSEFGVMDPSAQKSPRADTSAKNASQKPTDGKALAAASAPKDQVVVQISETDAPILTADHRPVLVIPALQPEPPSAPREEKSWKPLLPPLKSLEGK